MKLIIDTCSWLKIQYLNTINIIDLRPLIFESDLWMTHQLHEEFRYHLGDYLDYSKFSIKKVQIKLLKEYTEKQLDDADLSIIAFCRDQTDTITISDDGPVLKVLKMFNIRAFQLSEFIYFLVTEKILSKNYGIKTIKQLREWKNIKEKKKDSLVFEINHL